MSVFSQTPFITGEERPQQLAAGKASHSAAAGLLSGVCGFPEYRTRQDFATTSSKKRMLKIREPTEDVVEK